MARVPGGQPVEARSISTSSETQAPSRGPTICSKRRDPGGLGNRKDGTARGLGQVEAHREGEAGLDHGVCEDVRRPARVRAHEGAGVDSARGQLQKDARLKTSMWSEAVFEPALPGRRTPERASRLVAS